MPSCRVPSFLPGFSAAALVNANFPVFALSDGDKTSLKAERGSDGTLKVHAITTGIEEVATFTGSALGSLLARSWPWVLVRKVVPAAS